MQFDEGELGGAVDRDEEMELACGGLDFGNVDVEVADRVGFELFLRGLVALNIRQATDPMALQAAVQRGPRQVRDRRLEGIEAIVEGQERLPPERDDDRLLVDR
jgi:hypothetical protein